MAPNDMPKNYQGENVMPPLVERVAALEAWRKELEKSHKPSDQESPAAWPEPLPPPKDRAEAIARAHRGCDALGSSAADRDRAVKHAEDQFPAAQEATEDEATFGALMRLLAMRGTVLEADMACARTILAAIKAGNIPGVYAGLHASDAVIDGLKAKLAEAIERAALPTGKERMYDAASEVLDTLGIDKTSKEGLTFTLAHRISVLNDEAEREKGMAYAAAAKSDQARDAARAELTEARRDRDALWKVNAVLRTAQEERDAARAELEKCSERVKEARELLSGIHSKRAMGLNGNALEHMAVADQSMVKRIEAWLIQKDAP